MRRPAPGRASAAFTLAGIVLGAVLLAFFFHHSPVPWSEMLETLRPLKPWGLVLVFATTALHCLLTAWKWRFVTRLTAVGADLGLGYYHYTALIALFAQVLPVQIAVMAGRSIALRIHHRVPVRRAAAGALHDQAFDILVPLVVLPPALLYFLGKIGGAGAALTSLALLIAGGIAFAALGGAMLPRAARALSVLARLLPPAGGGGGSFARLYEPRALAAIYALSAARFLNLVLRAWLVAWSVGLDIGLDVMLYCYALVTCALVLGFVPGALGVIEWGWVATLSAFGADAPAAFQYAIASRLIVVAALVALNLTNALAVPIYRGLCAWIRRRSDS
ncbi:MAG: flippase-like domain-containing protein [Candidatus Hydrogenedentes bacterium]|nr:flippase-like domain-containing protein [Candidatus Hydrogenedentota bacterium]